MGAPNEILAGFNLLSDDGWTDAAAAADEYLAETDALADGEPGPDVVALVDRRHKIYRAAVAELAKAEQQRELRRAVAEANRDAAVIDLRGRGQPGASP